MLGQREQQVQKYNRKKECGKLRNPCEDLCYRNRSLNKERQRVWGHPVSHGRICAKE